MENWIGTEYFTCMKQDTEHAFSLTALAHGASRYKFTRPHLTEENILRIVAGRFVVALETANCFFFKIYRRHPLQELTVPSFVANDTFLVGGRGQQRSETVSTETEGGILFNEPNIGDTMVNRPSMLMLTGPNYSGKSVLLKQVCNLVSIVEFHINDKLRLL